MNSSHFSLYLIAGVTTLETVVLKVQDFVNYFAIKLYQLNPHHFIAKQQSQFLKESKDNLAPGEFIVISDFAENYTFVVQDAIQAFYWTNLQCTIHPFSIYYNNGDKLETISLVVVAESLAHNIVSVRLFQDKLIEFMKKKFPIIKKIKLLSDGAGGQYKNKKNLYNLCEMETNHGFKVEWHFFATSHGKGPCDALGGTIKRMATRTSLQRPTDNQFLNAKDLFDWLQTTDIAIHTVFCSKDEHKAMEGELKNKYRDVLTIQGTLKLHCFIPNGDFSFTCKRYSNSTEQTIVSIIK